jgi:hypothetical protein
MNTLSEPPSQPFISRIRATLTHAIHPVFRFQSLPLSQPHGPRAALCRARHSEFAEEIETFLWNG